jgi:hypothetical protein
MRLTALFLVALAASAAADDSWMGWQTVNDGQSNGIEVSFRPLTSATCGKPKPFVVIFPRFRNNYTERVTGSLEVVHTDLNGTTTDTIAFALDPNETTALTSSPVCVDTSKPIKIAIVGLRFPARDAEQKKIADAKAAADKAAAEKAAQQKAAADKLAAEQAAAEAARKKQLETSHKESQDFTKSRDEKQARRSDAERDENERKRVAALEEEQAARERMEATKKAQLADLRRGEFSFLLPTGYQRVEYASTPDNGLAVGVRGELRVFAWWAVRGERGSPQGNGFEFALSGGYQKLTDALADGAATGSTSLFTGFARVRFWRSPLAVGLAGEWNQYSYAANGMTEKPSVVALGPEIAIGFAANRLIAVELGARAGAAGPGLGDLKFSFSDDLYLAAYGVVGMNYLYAGATATRYVLSAGGVPQMWSAIGMLGIRVPF